jgi:hypothetical protein
MDGDPKIDTWEQAATGWSAGHLAGSVLLVAYCLIITFKENLVMAACDTDWPWPLREQH